MEAGCGRVAFSLTQILIDHSLIIIESCHFSRCRGDAGGVNNIDCNQFSGSCFISFAGIGFIGSISDAEQYSLINRDCGLSCLSQLATCFAIYYVSVFASVSLYVGEWLISNLVSCSPEFTSRSCFMLS